jgi:hypothetical protein
MTLHVEGCYGINLEQALGGFRTMIPGRIIAISLAVAFASSAQAADTDACPTGLICASKPETVAAAMQKAGYQAKLDKDKTGDPMISSAASGYNYDIWFYGCDKNTDCDSLQFQISFLKDDTNTVDLANVWNKAKRFGQANIDDKGRFVVSFDVTTIGGLTPKNFEDVVAWWSGTLANLDKFWKEHPSKAKS